MNNDTDTNDGDGPCTEKRAILNDFSENKIRQLQMAVDNAHVSIVVTDARGTIVYANPFFSKLTGYSEEEYIGANPRVLKSGIHSDEYYKELWETIKSGKTWSGEFYNRKKNGDFYWEEAVISPVCDEDGRIVNFVAVKSDITENKLNIQNLILAKEYAEANEIRLEAAFYTSPASISITKLNGEYVDVNERFLKISGYTKQELIGKLSTDFAIWVPPEDRNMFLGILLKDKHVENFETIFRLKGDKLINCMLSAKLIEIKNEPYILMVSNDITNQKITEAELLAAKEKAEESNRLKTSFLQNLSHEIRTPMNAIMGFSNLLLDNICDKDTITEYVKIINDRCADLLLIIDDILDIAKIESGQITLFKERINIGDLFLELKDMFVYQNQYVYNKNLTIKFTFDSNIDSDTFTFFSDSCKLKQIFSYLISNAVKFTATSEGEVEIGVALDKSHSDKVMFYIKDSGIGIPQDKREVIFERFLQLEQTNKRMYGGNGLGLAISKGLVKALGGDIWIESEVDKGSTFYFTINSPETP